MMKLIDLTGQRFGKLVVIKRAENSPSHDTRWACQCDCGRKTISYSAELRNGMTKSCGCLRKDPGKEPHYIHGGAKTRLFKIWIDMKSRCYYESNTRFNRYGGRGISVCKEWDESFSTFRDWALQHGYQDDLSIDRINVDGNYEPSNCRWATSKQQGRNKENTVYVLLNGKLVSLYDAADYLGIKTKSAWCRYSRGQRISDEIERLDGVVQKDVRKYTKSN